MKFKLNKLKVGGRMDKIQLRKLVLSEHLVVLESLEHFVVLEKVGSDFKSLDLINIICF